MIRTATPQDAKQVCNIYNHYVDSTIITFEEEHVTPAEMEKRMLEIMPLYPYLVYEANNEIMGYAYANAWKERSAYRFTVETTVYLKHNAVGKGLGTLLYKELLGMFDPQEVHAVIGVISLPNNKSVQLHEKLGFKKVAHFTEVGYKFEQWIDVGYWELILT